MVAPSPVPPVGAEQAGFGAGSRARATRPRDTRSREEPQTAGGGWGWRAVLAAAWRWRRELRPAALGLGLLGVPAVGHLASGGLAWVPLVVGAAGYGAAALYGHRPIHAWYGYGSVAAGLWAAACWWVGIVDPVVVGSYVAGLIAAAVIWARHVHPRARVRVVGGSVWPWHWEAFHFQRTSRREVRWAMDRWKVASFWGRVPRSEIRAAIADIDEDHILLTVELVPGHLDLDLDNRRAASAIGAPVAHVVVVQHDRDTEQPANVVQVRWYRWGLPVVAAAEEPVAEEPERPRPAPVDFEAERLARLRQAVDRLGVGAVSARALAKEAGLPHDWVNKHISRLAPQLGLRRAKGQGWQRLAVAAGGER